MKLVIQIPCYNEAKNLPQTIADLPLEIPGITSIQRLVISDGSTDATVEVAKALGVEHILHFAKNRGLARTFESGMIFASQALEADILVNVDGDNQYQASHIPQLVQTLLNNPDVGICLGERDVNQIPEFSPLKRWASRMGSRVVSRMAGIPTKDAPTGFRAITRQTARRITILSKYTYTLEMLIQARAKGIRITSLPVGTNPKTRPSRLMRSSAEYILKSILSLGVLVILYEPIYLLWLSLLATALMMPAAWFLLPQGSPWFNLLFYGGALLPVLGGILTALFKTLITMRIQSEEQLLLNRPSYSPKEWSQRLGATQYLHNGSPA